MDIQKETNKLSKLPKRLFAGQIHYSRIPVQYWEHRIKMCKSLGLNSLSIYIMWNYHETERGKFDFQTDNKNLPKFLSLAKEMGLKVLIRPGPYVCAQWDFGGMPARLLNIEGLKIRSNNPQFLQQTMIYFQALVPILQPYIDDGTIVMLQIENQYGFYGTDKSYMQAIRNIWRQLKFGPVEQYYVDWIQNIIKCHWKGANIGLNNGTNQKDWKVVNDLSPQGYHLGGQIYSGWMTHWGTEKWGSKPIQKVLQQYQFLLSHHHSFAMYMVHGGTNFGLTGGANGLKNQVRDYHSDITSYDYDAPINQQGSATQKYLKLRELIIKHVDWKVPQIPKNIKVIEIPSFKPQPYASLLCNLKEPIIKGSLKPYLFECNELQMFDQGFVLYQTKLLKGAYHFNINVHDFGLIYLNNKLIATLDRSQKTLHEVVFVCEEQSSSFKILVQAMGHINFGQQMNTDYKGLYEFSSKQKIQILWDIYPIRIKNNQILKYQIYDEKVDSPILSKISIDLKNEQVGDTYLDMKNYKKGYAWVNGHNLGRYWSTRGPQQKLFCPGVWLKPKQNKIIVFQLVDKQNHEIEGSLTLV